MQKTVRNLGFAMLLTQLVGCSAFGFFFERLDWLIVWRADDIFDLSEAQEDRLRPKAIALREWLRRDGFVQARRLLASVRTQWQAGEQLQAYLSLEAGIEALTPVFLEQAAPLVEEICQDFTPANARAFRAYTEANYEDWFEYAQSDEHKAEARADRLSDWFGTLNDAQVARVRAGARLEPNERQIRIDNSLQWRERMILAALSGDQGEIARWIRQPDRWWTPDYAALHQRTLQQVRATVFDLLPTLSTRQRQHIEYRVSDWIETLEAVNH